MIWDPEDLEIILFVRTLLAAAHPEYSYSNHRGMPKSSSLASSLRTSKSSFPIFHLPNSHALIQNPDFLPSAIYLLSSPIPSALQPSSPTSPLSLRLHQPSLQPTITSWAACQTYPFPPRWLDSTFCTRDPPTSRTS